MSTNIAAAGNQPNPYDTCIQMNSQNLYFAGSDQPHSFAETSTDFHTPASNTEKKVAAAWPKHYEGNDNSWSSNYEFAGVSANRPNPLENAPSIPWGEQYEQGDGSWGSQYDVNVRDRMWKMAFNPIPDTPPDAPKISAHSYSLDASKPSPSFCKKVVGKIWGSSWKKCWGRRVLTSLATAASVVIPVAIVILSKSSQASGATEENPPEITATTIGFVNATAATVAHVATSALNFSNATAAIVDVINATTAALALTNATTAIANFVNATTTALGFVNATATPSSVAPTPNATNATINLADFVWTQTSAPSAGWTAITSSFSGQFLAAVQASDSQGNGYIYVSSNYGTNWSATSAFGSWSSVASSSSGQFLVAGQVCCSNHIYISSNYGASWSLTTAIASYWAGVASSASGQFLIAVQESGGHIYISSNYGASWSRTSAPISNWRCVTSSASGQFLAAVNLNEYNIYVSSNYGASWSATILPGIYLSVAVSSSGQFLATGQADYGPLYISSNYGANWSPSSAPPGDWAAVSISSNGTQITAVQYNGGVAGGLPNVGGIWIGTLL